MGKDIGVSVSFCSLYLKDIGLSEFSESIEVMESMESLVLRSRSAVG